METTSMHCGSNEDNKPYIRHPAVAGPYGFYPSKPDVLLNDIRSYIDGAEKYGESKPFGLVSPHAGYVYSGPVAGWAYRQIVDFSYKTVIVISPSHFVRLQKVSVMPAGAYQTPLGNVEIDSELASRLVEQGGEGMELSLNGHLNSGMGSVEHALEVQLPFLQVVLGDFKLVPIIIGNTGWDLCRQLGRALAEVVDDDILIVASSDLSHFHPYKQAMTIDQNVINAIQAGDGATIAEGCRAGALEACGGTPIASLLAAAKENEKTQIEILRHANSGDVPGGSKDQVVGYLAAAVY
jgi:MEMO1 family protein